MGQLGYWRRYIRTVHAPATDLFAQALREQLEELRADSTPLRSAFDRGIWTARIEEAMRAYYESSFLGAGGDLISQLSPEKAARMRGMITKVPAAGDPVRIAIDTLSERIVDVVEGIHERFSELLDEAVEEQLTTDALDERFEEVWDDILETRVQMIAGTEVQIAMSASRHYVVGEVADYSSWTTAGDERVRANHVVYGMGGQRLVGFNWPSLVGESYTLRYPCDPECTEPGEVINCRCLEMPADPEDASRMEEQFSDSDEE